MKKTLLSLSGALALAVLSPTETAAQFTVWKDGMSVYALEEGRADYVTFDYSPVGSIAESNPDPSVGGAVSAAQFTVWKDGVSVYALEEGRADYVTFDYSPVGSLAEANPDPSVGGAVPDESVAVDLGLSSGTLWAPWNVGATKPGEAGAYFSWGETTAKESYDWGTYKWMKEGESDWAHITKYTTKDGQTTADWYTDEFIGDGKTTLDDSDDAAAQNWGGRWRMPTHAQLNELFHECTYEWKNADWDANGSIAGYLLTSKANGNTIFLPAAGYRWDSGLDYVGSLGFYWSAELDSGSSYYARSLYFRSGYWNAVYNDYRYFGYSVRPVCPSAE